MDTIASNATSDTPMIVASVLPMPFVNKPVLGTAGSMGVELPGSTILSVILLMRLPPYYLLNFFI